MYLFGSYARGEAREQSDLDFLVVEKALKSKWKAVKNPDCNFKRYQGYARRATLEHSGKKVMPLNPSAKKRNLQRERVELLARYKAATVEELENKIREGTVPEHPAWEDLIEIKNIEAEIRAIDI